MSNQRQLEIDVFAAGLNDRAESKCELCAATQSLIVVDVPPELKASEERCALLCETCKSELEKGDDLNVNHWFCLNESAWTQVPAVQVLVWRLLNKLSAEDWAQSLLEQIYLEDDVRKWAEEGADESSVIVKDSNGGLLQEGDTVTIIKDLDVKGTSFVAKRGTIVKNIHLGSDAELVEGRVNGTVIFLKTCFLKKN